MQASPFETGYHHHHLHHHQGTAVYGSVPGFDSSGLKFHHGGYPDASTADAATCYQNYMNAGVVVTQGYAPRDPPSYAESTTTSTSAALFHPDFMPSSSPGYYKTSGGGSTGNSVSAGSVGHIRQIDMVGEYSGMMRSPPSGLADNFLMKQEVLGNSNGSLMDYGGRYAEENMQQRQQHPHHHLHHHHHHHQHAQHHKQAMQLGSELVQENCKLEPETDSDYKHQDDIGASVSVNVTLPGLQSDEDNRDVAPSSKEHVRDSHSQSSCGDDASIEGTDMSIRCQDKNSASGPNSDQSKQQQQVDGGDEQGKTTSNDVKPTLSYIALIAKSILESPQRRLNLGSIYSWIEKNFPYYKNRGQGWRNSVRHNLSLNDCFIKAGRCEDGKGNYWAIHPANMQDFLRGDFRQRRRSRRRGRKKDCELGMYHHHQFANGYLGAAAASGAAAAAAAAAGGPLGHQMSFPPTAAAISSIYSPYTEAERRAYRLDEALLRQSMNNPFFKWYQPSSYPPASSPPSACNAGVYSGVGGIGGVGSVGSSSTQWPQTYPDNSAQSVYPLNSSFSR